MSGALKGRIIGVVSLSLSLAACTGSLFQSKAAPPTIYMLAPTDLRLPAERAPIAVDLAVLKPRVRTGLESDRIAVLYPDRRLDYFAAARWTGPLSDVLQDLAVQVFHLRANLRGVSGDASAFASAYWLEIEVTDFQAEYSSSAAAPTVHIHLLARFGSSSERRVLARFEASARQAATENRVTAIVDAYAHAADAVLAEIAVHAADALRQTLDLEAR